MNEESVGQPLGRDEIAAMEREDLDDLDFVAASPNAGRRSEPSQVYSLRIPVRYLERLRKAADALGEQPSSLMRRWVVERLDGEAQAKSAATAGAIRIDKVGRPAVLGRAAGARQTSSGPWGDSIHVGTAVGGDYGRLVLMQRIKEGVR